MQGEYLDERDNFLSDDGMSFSRPLSVSEINGFIKEMFDTVPVFRSVYIRGEISNFKNHSATGHFYFTLKDSASSVRAVMFRSYASRVRFIPENGMTVVVHGRISSFERDGQYQIYCDSMEPLGVGALWAAFEQLKKKLAKEGIFSEEHKKALPPFPKRVGIVTSASGAAVRDIINVLGRRCPLCEVLIYPCLVQGEGADKTVIEGIEYFNTQRCADVIIIGRGGGSIEDLWAFNSEMLAYAIYNSEIPIISAVGHETDFTVADFAADVRAPTPSAAAELAVPDMSSAVSFLKKSENSLYALMTSYISLKRQSLEKLSASRVMSGPTAYIDEKNMNLLRLSERLCAAAESSGEMRRTKLLALARTLDGLSPLSVLRRGYSAVFGDGGKLVKRASDVMTGEKIKIKTGDGDIGAVVTETVNIND